MICCVSSKHNEESPILWFSCNDVLVASKTSITFFLCFVLLEHFKVTNLSTTSIY